MLRYYGYLYRYLPHTPPHSLRYLHYYQRYHGHDSALKFAATQRAQAEARMVEQQEAQKSSWIDVQFLKQAAEQVRCAC